MAGPTSLDEIRALYDFSGKTAVVTGGTGVLGSEMARALAVANANVVLLARNVERAEAVLAGDPGQRGHAGLLPDRAKSLFADGQRDRGAHGPGQEDHGAHADGALRHARRSVGRAAVAAVAGGALRDRHRGPGGRRLHRL